jgi:Zn-dependent peptidase ImmA (M78 family)/transcriptional regulator with XRE-family HTH domain
MPENEVGARIRRIRLAAGLLAQDLAERIGLDPTVLSKIENGRRDLKSTELARVADALKISPLALLEDNPLLSKLPLAARRAGPSIQSCAAYDRIVSIAELHVILADAGIPTSPSLAAVPSVGGFDWLEAATALAEWASERLPLGPWGDRRLAELSDLIETELGVDVFIDAFSDDALSGATITSHLFPLVFVNSSYPRSHSLFTLAHELGHLLAGHADDGVVLDRRELAGSTDVERMVNAFAARYLLPETDIIQALDEDGRRLSTLVKLSEEYGVSYQSLVYRMHNLRLINAAGRDRLLEMSWQQLVSQTMPELPTLGFSRERRGKLLPRGQNRPGWRPPALLVRRAFEGYQKGVISVRPLAGLLKEDPARLLERLTEADDPAAISAFLSTPQSFQGSEEETPEQIYSGSPV